MNIAGISSSVVTAYPYIPDLPYSSVPSWSAKTKFRYASLYNEFNFASPINSIDGSNLSILLI